MWAMHVGNPFTSQRRVREKEERVLEDAQRDREEREALRVAAWGSSARSNDMAKDMERISRTQTKTKASLAERAKYQFEAVSLTMHIWLGQS
jgi:protein transport protein SEC9